jgi:multiple sugar transport system substrate-binding protein
LLALLLALVAPALAGSFAEAQAAPPTTLRLVAYYRTGLLQEVMQELVADYNASHPGVVVRLEYVPFADLKRYLLVANASGELPDLAVVDNPDHAFFAEAGLFLDITERVQHWSGNGRFFAGPWRSTFHRGRQYGVPFTNNCLALFYDKAALAAAGVSVPETWEQLRNAARRLTAPGRYGLAIGAVRSEEGTFQFLSWFLSAGGDFTRLDSPGAVRALAFLRGLIVDGAMSPEVIDWTQGDAQKQFSAGRAALMVNGPWSILQLERDTAGRTLRYGIARLPRDVRSATPLGGENIAITRQAHVEAAWDFVQFVTSREAMERAGQRRGFLPPRTDVLRSGAGWGGDPAFRVFMELMPDAVARGPHPRWPELSELLQGALQEALSGAQPPHDALAEAQRRLQALGLAPDGR